MTIRSVTLFSNGILMVIDGGGEQLPEYQGPVSECLVKVLEDAPESARFQIGDFRNGVVETNRACFETLAKGLKS